MKKPSLALSAIERMILAVPRRGMRKNAAKKLRAAVGAIDQCIKTRGKLAKYKMPDVLRLYDASIFCLMYDADLTVLSRDMTCRSDWWESRLYGRLLAMTMLECVEDIPAVLGKKFRNSLAVVVLDVSHQSRVAFISKSLSDFCKRHGKELRHVRTIAAAHRDHDAGVQAAVIEELDIRALIKMAGELNDLLGSLARAMTNIFLQINAVRELLRSSVRSS
jgi:hypothetical protein